MQLAAAWGARVIAVVSSDDKADVARPPARTMSSSLTVSGMPSLTSRAGAASTSWSTPWAATASPTRCARCPRAGGCSSSASRQGRSPRSRSTDCCWATSVVGVGWGAWWTGRGGPGPAYLRRQWDDLLPLLESGAIDPVIGEVRELDDVVAALTAVDERRAIGKILLTPDPLTP